MDMFAESTRRNPHAMYAHLREHAPVLHLAEQRLYIASRYDACKRILHDHESFSARVSPARGLEFEWLLFTDPPRHTALRAIVSKAFTPKTIAALEPRIRAISAQLIAAMRDRDEVELVEAYGTALPLLVIAELLGLPDPDRAQLARWSVAIMNLGNTISGTGADQASAAFLAADAEMSAYFTALIAERRARPTGDVLTRLALGEADGARLTDTELLRFCELLLAAGTETTTNLIDNAMVCFAEHPDQLARLRAEPRLLPSAIEEVLRFRTPIAAMFRVARRDVELDGTMIPEGGFCVASIGAANRDPRAFAASEQFDIGRDPNPHIAFGHGLHYCLGAPLARLEARIGLADLFAHIRSYELVDREWRPRSSFHVHGPAELRLRVRWNIP